MSLKRRFRINIKSELIAIAIFSFLVAITISLFVLKKDILALGTYVEVFRYQLKNVDISRGRLFLFIFEKRLIYLLFLLLFSGLIKKKYKGPIFYSVFFFAYGLFFIVNICLLGFKGILTSALILLPQCILYFFVYSRLMKDNNENKNYIKVIEIVFMIFGIFIASAIETYVNLMLILKIL